MQGQTGLDQAITQLTVATPGRSMVEVTARVQDWLSGAGADTGLLTIFMQHTSASLTIQENADPDVQADLLDSLDLRLLDLSDKEILKQVEGTEAVVSCLGHNGSLLE